jgi:hypothetical protein
MSFGKWTKRNLKLIQSEKSYFIILFNFNRPWFLRSRSQFWILSTVRKVIKFSRILLFNVPSDRLEVSLKSKFVQTVWSVQNWRLLQILVTITPEPLVGWGCICSFWKCLKILYHFYIGNFSWFCTIFSQQSFARSSSVWIKIYIQGSSTCALFSNDHNFVPVYWIWAYQ